jgi:hypothetical protein
MPSSDAKMRAAAELALQDQSRAYAIERLAAAAMFVAATLHAEGLMVVSSVAGEGLEGPVFMLHTVEVLLSRLVDLTGIPRAEILKLLEPPEQGSLRV